MIAGAGSSSVAVHIAGGSAVAVAVFGFSVCQIFPFFTFNFNALDERALQIYSTFLLFLLLLPLLNAIADFLSVAATRHFLRRIAARKIGVWGVLAGLALDILIAVLCLTLLLVLMTQTLDLWARTAAFPCHSTGAATATPCAAATGGVARCCG